MADEIPSLPPVQKQHHENMPKLNIEINSRIHIKMNPLSQSSRSMPGEFLGLSHFDFLILRLPSVPGLRNQLLPRTLLDVRYLLDGAVNSFYSEVISHVVKPTLMVFSTYPDKLNIIEMRNSRRTTCALPVVINSSIGDAKGILLDLSLGGCRFAIDLTGQSNFCQLAINDTIVVQLSLSPEALSLGCSATVRSIEISGSKLMAGVSFDDPVKEFSASVGSYLGMASFLA